MKLLVKINLVLLALLTAALTAVRPVTRISALADRISLGELDAPDFKVKSRDEIGTLATSFSRMRASLVQAFKMLDG